MRFASWFKLKRTRNIPGLVYWKPVTPSLRGRISIDYKFLGVHDGPPVKELSKRVDHSGGRDRFGNRTVWFRGGPSTMDKVVRSVDFHRNDLDGVAGTVTRIERDPWRSGWLALVKYPQRE